MVLSGRPPVVGAAACARRPHLPPLGSVLAVPFEEDDKDPSIWFLDHNYLENMFRMFKKVNGRFVWGGLHVVRSVHLLYYANVLVARPRDFHMTPSIRIPVQHVKGLLAGTTPVHALGSLTLTSTPCFLPTATIQCLSLQKYR